MKPKNLRITSGAFKGRTLKSPSTAKTHPMGDREKLALFNRIAPYLSGARVLDLYAGSGALGLEALSRGAKYAVFVDSDGKAIATIKANIAALALESVTEVIKSKADNQIFNQSFDVIFCDPPYDNFTPDAFTNIADSLAADGVFVLSHPETAPELPNLTLESTKSYAAAHLSIYVKTPQ